MSRAMRTLGLVLLTLSALRCSSDKDAAGSGDDDKVGEPTQTKDAGAGSGRKDSSAGNQGGTRRDGGAGGGKDDGPTAMPEGDACGDTIIRAKPVPADILIVQDRSSSMSGVSVSQAAGSDRWTPSVAALKQVVADYDDQLRFGLLVFPSEGQSCDKGTLTVPISEMASDEISAALDMNAPSLLFNGIGQTPTDLALKQALEVIESRPLTNVDLGVLSDAYVILVTDGAPGCNLGSTEQARVNASNTAIDALLKAGVKTYVVGYDIDAPGQTIMNEFAKRGGTDKFIAVNTMDAQSLEKALRDVTAGNVPCKFALPGTPASTSDVTVKIDDKDVVISPDNGWSIDGKIVQFNGGTCDGIRDGMPHNVQVNVPCNVILL